MLIVSNSTVENNTGKQNGVWVIQKIGFHAHPFSELKKISRFMYRSG